MNQYKLVYELNSKPIVQTFQAKDDNKAILHANELAASYMQEREYQLYNISRREHRIL